MGWCSGSDIFDTAVNTVEPLVKIGMLPEEEGTKILKAIADTLYSMDWDCDDPYGVPWIDLAMGYIRCDKHDAAYREHWGCGTCEDEGDKV